MSALLSGLLLNIGVYALIRFKILVDPVITNQLAGHLMMAFGLLSFLVAGFLSIANGISNACLVIHPSSIWGLLYLLLA